MVREGRFLPLEENDANRALFDTYVQSAKEMGFEVAGEYTGGSADSGFTSAVGTPTLCGMGPVGGYCGGGKENAEDSDECGGVVHGVALSRTDPMLRCAQHSALGIIMTSLSRTLSAAKHRIVFSCKRIHSAQTGECMVASDSLYSLKLVAGRPAGISFS